MNKKFLSNVFALLISGTVAFGQTKTETTKPVTTPGTTTTAPTTTVAPSEKMKQPVTPPATVSEKFKTMYPAINEVRWIQNKQENYVAVFKNGTNECRVAYKADGSFVREMTVIQQSALPEMAKSYLTKTFAGETPKKCEQVKNSKGVVNYIISYEGKTIRLDSKGNEVVQDQTMEKAE